MEERDSKVAKRFKLPKIISPLDFDKVSGSSFMLFAFKTPSLLGIAKGNYGIFVSHLLQYGLCHSMVLNFYSLYYKYWYLSDKYWQSFCFSNR